MLSRRVKVLVAIVCFVGGLLVCCVDRQSQSRVASGRAMSELIGRRVTVVGTAEPRKIGAAVRGEDFEVWIDGLHDWTEEFSGKQVEVVGILEERNDLP